MIVQISIIENLEEPEYSLEKFVAKDNRFQLEVCGEEYNQVLNEIKGIVLVAIGQFKVVPDKVEFKLVRFEINMES